MPRLSHSPFRSALLFALLPMLYTGCDFVTHPESRQTTLFSSLETRAVAPVIVEDVPPNLSPQEASTYKTIIDGFSKNASERLGEDEVMRHLERIDQIYIVSGRYLELIKIYEDDVKKRGMDSRVAGRLAFAYVRLDQADAAKPLIDKLLDHAPDDPTVHFISGMFWVRQERTIENMGRALESMERTLQIEPNYRGYEGITAGQLQQQIDQLRQIVPPDWKAQVQAAKVDEPQPEEKPEEQPTSEPNPEEQPTKETEKQEETEPVAENPEPEQPKESPIPKPESEVVTQKAPEQQEAKLDFAKDQMYILLVAEAEIAIHEGRTKEAEQKFNAAKRLNPYGFAAEFGHLKAGWRVESARNNIAVEVRELAKRENLTAQETFDLGFFVHAKMTDKVLARELWERTQKLDPALAKRLGVETLLSSL